MAKTSAYTGFTNLPNEVLEKIALAILGQEDSHDIDERNTSNLARFALLDKHIYEIATKILYKKIDISTLVARPLLDTVLQNQKLAALVREVSFSFTLYDEDWEDGDDSEKKPLTTVQTTIFSKVLQRVLAELRYDGSDPTCFFEGESPAAEAGLLLYALPNLISLGFGRDNSETFNIIYRSHPDVSTALFRRCIEGIFPKTLAAVPAALLSLESFVFTPPDFRNGDDDLGTWDIEAVAPIFFCPKIRSIELCGARSAYPYVTNRSGVRLEGFAPSFGGDVIEMGGPRAHVEQTDSDGEEDGLNGQCHKCQKQEIQIQTTLKRCMKCKKRLYCSKECQTGDWPSHKKACKKEKMHHKFPRTVDIDKLRSSPLEVLSLREADLHAKVLRKILSQPRALKSFTYVKHPDNDLDQGSHLPMKPKLFQLALEEQQDSLETLEVELRLPHQKSLMNLSHFKLLKNLKIEVLLLVWRPPMEIGIPLCDTLPPSLKTLTLDFCTWCYKLWCYKPVFPMRPKCLDDNVFEAIAFHLRGIAERAQPLERLCIFLPRLRQSKTRGLPEGWKATERMAEGLFRPTGTELVIKCPFSEA